MGRVHGVAHFPIALPRDEVSVQNYIELRDEVIKPGKPVYRDTTTQK